MRYATIYINWRRPDKRRSGDGKNEERKKTKTIGVSARPVWIGGPWRTVRPAAGRRNRNHGEERQNDPDRRHGLKNPESVPNIRSSRRRARSDHDERVAAQRHVRAMDRTKNKKDKDNWRQCAAGVDRRAVANHGARCWPPGMMPRRRTEERSGPVFRRSPGPPT